MSTTIAVRFPLGRYHATPWNRSVNEGTTEWPPSPWRVLRALVATWHTRWPDLPAQEIEGLLEALGGSPAYRTPPARPGHTRHYMPDSDHAIGQPGNTDLTLDPFLSVSRHDELLIRWDADLTSEQRQILAKLTELIPYLGRADSACEARLLDEDPQPDPTWWQPGASGTRQTRLLAPTRPVTRAALEATTVQVRRSRHKTPLGTAWVSYGAQPQPSVTARRHSTARTVQAVRFAITGPVPLRSTHGILLADIAHRQAGRKLAAAGIPDERRQEILGTRGATSNHQHAHWLPIAEGNARGTAVATLILWVPAGLAPEEVASIVTLRETHSAGYEVRGFPKVTLLFQAAGTIQQVAPELCGPSRQWQSLTPYLPVRHRKRESPDDFMSADVAAELAYRDLPAAHVVPADTSGGLPDRWAKEFRRYRMAERLSQSRQGLGLRLEFNLETEGPLLLGQLSHFGYGVFVPEGG